MEVLRSAEVSLSDKANSSRCSECEGRMTEITRMQYELNDSKDQITKLFDDVGDLAGKLDEEEAITYEKKETMKTV
ncbi:hypothetical protein GCK32_014232 [Trichostrongylus colubriformis]|uniref:Uncharacterized protein n=1 Tax=Trichostrongylus colubriformis TaxID=6319 RepID=A0AAN8F8J1_TRICO